MTDIDRSVIDRKEASAIALGLSMAILKLDRSDESLLGHARALEEYLRAEQAFHQELDRALKWVENRLKVLVEGR